MLKHSDLELGSNLGKGNFGSVMRGTYRLRGQAIDVAVKVLKANDAAAEVSVVFCALYRRYTILKNRHIFVKHKICTKVFENTFMYYVKPRSTILHIVPN